MRSICNIDFKNNVAWGSSASAQSINEILLSIYPAENMKSNLRIEITDTKGKVITESVERERNGLINHTLSSLYYLTAGTFKLRLLSDEENSSYVLYKTLENLTDGDDIVCKYRFATQTFEVYKIVIESSAGSDYDDKPLWDAVEEIRVKYLTVDAFNAEKATIYDLIAEKANITDLTAINAEIENLKANKADIGELNAEIAKVNELIAKKANVDDLHAIEATIEQLNAHIANIDKAIIDVAHIDDLEVINARIDNIEAGNIDTDALEAHFARIDLANIKDGCITNAMIGEGVIESAQIADGSITDAKIVTLTANKLTAGRIDASDIEVVNLNCANLTVGTINGKQITNGAIDWDKLASQVGNTINNADENASQALEDALKAYQEAQKANSAAGTAQSTANGKNTVIYANSQPSTSGRKTNDVWFDTDDSYKMYYFNGTAWVAAQFGTNAIKNASITTALIADAAINNAKIANLDAGKITSGYISSDRIQAGSIVIGKLDGNTQNTITTANSNASKALSDAAAASSKAGTAQSTADSALSKANTANSNANTALKSINIQDTRDTDEQPLYYFRNYPKRTVRELKYCKSVGLSGESYCELETTVPWGDKSGGYPTQIARLSISKKEYTRYGTSDTTWSEWVSLDVVIANWCYNNDKTYINGGKIYTGTVNAAQIAANAIIAGKIAANAVTTANLQADCVNADKIAAKAINAEHINGAIITSDKIVAGAITGDKIAARTIDATKIVANTITAAEIKAGTITGDKIAAGTIDASKIKAGTITATQIAANAITSEKITADAITSAKIKTDAIKSRNYVAGSVGSFLNLADGTFTSKNLKWTADGSITASNVNLTGAITATGGKIAGWSIGNSTISKQSGDFYVALSSSLTSNGDVLVVRKGTSSYTYPFCVRNDGTLYASNAKIKGKISGSSISGGTISGASITGGSITSGTTINVNTDLRVGNNIYIGSYSDRNTQKQVYLNDRFYMYSRNDVFGIGVNNGDLFRNKLYWTYTGSTLNLNATGSINIISDNSVLMQTPRIQCNGHVYANALFVGGKLLSDWNNGMTVGWGAFESGYGLRVYGDTMNFVCKGGTIEYYGKYIDGNWSSGRFNPAQYGTALGSNDNAKRWYRLYAANASSESSDIRLKCNIVDLDERYIDFYEMLRPITYNWKSNPNNKKEAGLIAQEVQEAMKMCNINNKEFGMIDDEGNHLGLIYRNLSILNLKYVQTKSKYFSIKMSKHEEEIAKLKNKINELQSKLNAYILGEMEVKKA